MAVKRTKRKTSGAKRRRRTSEEFRRQIEADYVYGLVDCPQLSEKYNIKLGTIKSRCSRENWDEKRKQNQLEVKSLTWDKFKAKFVSIAEIVLDGARTNAQLVTVAIKEILQEYQEYQKLDEKERPKVFMRKHLATIERITKTLKDCGGLMKTIMPEANSDQLDEIMDEIRKLQDKQDRMHTSSLIPQSKAM